MAQRNESADSTVLSELVRAVNTLTASQVDGLRTVESLTRSIDVALDKLNMLEGFAASLGEKTRRLDATHYTDCQEVKDSASSLVASVSDLKSNLQSIRDGLSSIPTSGQIQQTVDELLRIHSSTAAKQVQDSMVAVSGQWFNENRSEIHQVITEALRDSDEARAAAVRENFRTLLRECVPSGLSVIANKYVIYAVVGLFALLVLSVVVLSGVASQFSLEHDGDKVVIDMHPESSK